jgi:nucleotide-binding universal stress UspA family protein
MFHRILVGVDDSRAAREALERAIEVVEAGHGRLGLLSSAPAPPPIAAVGPTVVPVSRRQLEHELLDWAQRNVEEAAQRVPADIPITKIVRRGSASAALRREARTGCWDLVVVGGSRRRHRLLGSIGERVGRCGDVPVLVVHEEDTEPRRGRRPWLRLWPRRRRRPQPTIA